MNFLSHLAHEKLIQPHHLRAAIWFEELPSSHPAQAAIAEQCLSISRWTPTSDVNPLRLLKQVCIAHEPCGQKEIILGMLREALNSVDRCMRHDRRRV